MLKQTEFVFLFLEGLGLLSFGLFGVSLRGADVDRIGFYIERFGNLRFKLIKTVQGVFNVQVGLQRIQAHLVQQRMRNVDRRISTQGQSNSVAGTCVDVFYCVILLNDDPCVVR